MFLFAFLVLCWVPALVARAAEAPAAVDAEKQFAIVSIEPDADSRTVKIRFTQQIPFNVLRDHLKVYGGKITAPKGGPAAFEITDSQGEHAYSADAAVSAFGTAAGEFALKAHFPLRTYTLCTNWLVPFA